MLTPSLARFTSAASPRPARAPSTAVVLDGELAPSGDDDRPEELALLTRIERALHRGELHRRYALVQLEPDARPWVARPWARLGAAALVGFALGHSRAVRVAASMTVGVMLARAVDRALTHLGSALARG